METGDARVLVLVLGDDDHLWMLAHRIAGTLGAVAQDRDVSQDLLEHPWGCIAILCKSASTDDLIPLLRRIPVHFHWRGDLAIGAPYVLVCYAGAPDLTFDGAIAQVSPLALTHVYEAADVGFLIERIRRIAEPRPERPFPHRPSV
jgi:hypothetical protein